MDSDAQAKLKSSGIFPFRDFNIFSPTYTTIYVGFSLLSKLLMTNKFLLLPNNMGDLAIAGELQSDYHSKYWT